jgi:superfamily II DNA or RNA helicase
VRHLPPEDKRDDILFRGDRILLPAMVTRLLKEGKRLRLLLQWSEASYREGRHLMVISERLALLHELKAGLEKRGIMDVGLYIGGMKAEARDVSATKRVVLATYSMAAEGLDIPRLDTLLLASPRSNVEQSLGRILRAHPDKARPRVIDIVDDFSVFAGMAAQRRRLYRKHGFEVSTL